MLFNHKFKALNLIIILFLITLPLCIANAQPEEEEEPIQARPNPMDSRTNMKGMNQRSYDGFDGESKTQSMKNQSKMQHKMKRSGMQQPLNQKQQGNMIK